MHASNSWNNAKRAPKCRVRTRTQLVDLLVDQLIETLQRVEQERVESFDQQRRVNVVAAGIVPPPRIRWATSHAEHVRDIEPRKIVDISVATREFSCRVESEQQREIDATVCD